MKHAFHWIFFIIGNMIFSLGITMTINVKHLGIHPWEVLNVAMYEKVGFTIGTWSILISFLLVIISFILDRRYVKLGTFVNAFIIGLFVDFYLWAGFLPQATNTWTDVLVIIVGIIVMGIGGGMYNAAGVGSGPRDGFMLSISDKTGMSIRRVRIMTESSVLVVGLIIGGPVFVFTLIFTFVQSPIFQHSYTLFREFILKVDKMLGFNQKLEEKKS